MKRVGKLTIICAVKNKSAYSYCYCECGRFEEINKKSIRNGRKACTTCKPYKVGFKRCGLTDYWGANAKKLGQYAANKE